MNDFQKTILYTASADKTVSFAGISLYRIFFVTHDNVANYDEYITVNMSDANDVLNWHDDTNNNDIVNMSLECGFMYYYKKNDDSSYSLCRKKFGSENEVVLVENCSVTDYPVVYSNRLYFSTGSIGIGYGYQYVFLIGSKSENSESVCKASCIYTSSSGDNTLSFNGEKLTY